MPPAEAERALRDLDRVYRWLMFGAPLRRAVLDLVARGTGSGAGRAWVVDVGAGGGHVADDLMAAARRRGRRLTVVGVDAKLSHLLAGRRMGPRSSRSSPMRRRCRSPAGPWRARSRTSSSITSTMSPTAR